MKEAVEMNWEWEGENCKNGVGFGIDGGGGNKQEFCVNILGEGEGGREDEYV